MRKKSPLQLVKAQFGSKEKLVEKLIPRLTKPAEESDVDFAQRIGTASNRQLLRLWNAEERVEKEFSSREELLKTLVIKKFPNGNSAYKTKISRFTNTRLLDLVRK